MAAAGLISGFEATLDPGTHYVRVESYQDAEGSYTLHIDRQALEGTFGRRADEHYRDGVRPSASRRVRHGVR